MKDLSVTFKRPRGGFIKKSQAIKAVDRVSLELDESDIVSIVGESGSGKTTVARCIMGLTSPTAGSIKYNGVEATKLKAAERWRYWKEVQMVFQDPFESMNPRQDVYTIVSTPIRELLKERRKARVLEIVHEVINEVGLDAERVIHRFPHELSGGERQRVNIARALVSNPRVLIADEPITMLDAAQRLNILSLLMELKRKRNLTILLITHDLASAKMMSKRIIVMYRGKIVEAGETDALLSSPYHPYVELILQATPRLIRSSEVRGNAPQLAPIEGSSSHYSSTRSSSAAGCIFRPRCKYATEVCEKVEPPLEEKSKSHYAACHNPL